MTNVKFEAIRLVVLALVVFSQVYLFVHIRRAVRSLRLSRWIKSSVVVLLGLTIFLLFSVNRYTMVRPVVLAGTLKPAELVLFYAAAAWTLGSILSTIVLLVVHFAGWICRISSKIFTPSGRNACVPFDPARRRFLQIGLNGIAVAPFVFSGYGAVCASRDFEVKKIGLAFGRRLRVVQLTDIHAGIYMTREEMKRIADMVSGLEPDLFLLTGDYISNSPRFLPDCIEEMARVRARYGTFASLGNHEHWFSDLREVRTVFSRCGIPLLVNSHAVIDSGQGAFAVAGIDDLRAGDPDLDAALRGLDPALPVILLSHRPEVFPLASSRGISLTLSGHYHGGQIKLKSPLGDFSLADLVTQYPEGLFRLDASTLYVSSGIGTTFTPVRLNVPPEITLIELTA